MSRNSQAVPIPPRQTGRYAQYRELSISYEGDSHSIPVRAPDISTHGMFINTAHRFPEGAVLNICFRLARTNVLITARGEVRYCLPGVGVGVEFIRLPEKAQQAIEQEVAGTYQEVGA